MDFNGTSGVIEKLQRKTKYNYTVQVRDRNFMKFSKISVGKEFTTEEKGKNQIETTKYFLQLNYQNWNNLTDYGVMY